MWVLVRPSPYCLREPNHIHPNTYTLCRDLLPVYFLDLTETPPLATDPYPISSYVSCGKT